MKRPTTRDVCEAAEGRLVYGRHRALGPVSLDSRTLNAGDAFVCIRGPRFDGHSFADAAVAAGATVLIAEERGLRHLHTADEAGVTVVAVDDAEEALGRLAARHRRRFRGTVVGLTGSSGKTTTKEMVAAVLRRAGSTAATLGNQNNHLGVPLTLLRLEGETFAVVEMGMNAVGEIAWLCDLAAPRYGAITSIGAAHLEGLGTVEAVARAKGELFAALPANGLAFMPSDVPFAWRATADLRAPLVLVGRRRGDELRLTGARALKSGVAGHVHVDGVRHRLRLRLDGRHNLVNAMLALAVGRALGVPVVEGLEALAEVTPPPLRGEVRRLPDGTPVVLDCYNANPQSMRAALAAFARRGSPRLAVLGDMLELGEAAEAAHLDLGRVVAGLPGETLLVAVGAHAEQVVEGARSAGLRRAHAVADADAAARRVAELRGDRPILLKGSRGVRLERVWDALAAGEGR